MHNVKTNKYTMNLQERSKNIEAEIVAHSRNIETGDELITYRLTYPRIILAQLNTYKSITKITASSRAQPFNKVVEVIETLLYQWLTRRLTKVCKGQSILLQKRKSEKEI